MRKRWIVPLSLASLVAGMLLAATLLAPRAADAADQKKPSPPPTLKVGDVAPEFTLKDQTLKPVTLSEFRGKKSVVLAFYVFAFTGG
jgi:cytochrome oxidase Cu insertion factor (SCO1/SenC/PrrC family)